MDIRNLVKQALIKKENMRYEKLLAKKQTTYTEWLRDREREQQEKKLNNASQAPVCAEGSEIVCFVASEGEIVRNALDEILTYFASNPRARLLYGDEDVMQNGERSNPWFKPDWSPDLLDSSFYFGSLVAVRHEVISLMEHHCNTFYGGWNPKDFAAEGEKKGCQVYRVTDLEAYEKWIHLCMVQIKGYEKKKEAVGHISEILFHCDNENEQNKFLQMSPYLQERRQEHLKDFEEEWMLRENAQDVAGSPLVSVIIPSKDHPEILRQCLEGCRKVLGPEKSVGTKDADNLKTDTRETGHEISCEIIIVDNGSSEENRKKIEELVSRMDAENFSVVYKYHPMEFHFSRMCNMGAEAAKGAFLLFLNDDVELCEPGCIARMTAMASRPHTGAVGMKLYYPDSCKIQHAGITNLPMGPVHKLQFLDDNKCYYYNMNRGYRNLLAVTGACLMVEKDKFAEVGGFCEELPVAFNDVDLCYSLWELGYWNVCVNDMHAYHHESLSRGEDESEEKLERLRRECRKLYERHPELEGKDPFYSRHLQREGLDTKVRPAYETAKNHVQAKVELQSYDGKQYRQDNCVLLRIESLRKGRIQGYCVVLGDDNACYEKKLALIGEDGTLLWQIPLEAQYRPDLVENMPDQKNVGLCGFCIELSPEDFPAGKLAEKRYRVAVTVRNRVTGLRLTNNSNCYF